MLDTKRAGLAQYARRAAEHVTRSAGWLALPIVAALFSPQPWLLAGLVGAVGLHLARWVARASPLPATRVNLPLLLFLAMIALSLALSPARALGAAVAGQVVAGVTIFFVLVDNARTTADLWRMAALLALVGLFAALVAPFTVDLGVEKGVYGLPGFGGAAAAFPKLPKVTNANILAGALAAVVPFALALSVGRAAPWRVLGAVALAPMAIILILLQSRGALFALGVGLAAWATLYRRWLLPVLPFALLGALLWNNAVGGPPPAQFFYGKIGTPTGGTLAERQTMWMQAILLLRQSPLVGIGLGAYPRVAPYALPFSASAPGTVQPHAHNLFIQIALDTGILGLVTFLALLFGALRPLWRAYRLRFERDLAIAALAAFVVVVVHGLGDTIVWGTAKSSVVLWILFALAVSFDKLDKAV